MNLRIAFLPIKLAILIMMVFVSVDVSIKMAGILLLLVVIPKIQSMIDLIRYSGYMKSSAGIVYMVERDDRELAKAEGFMELSLFQSSTLTGDYPIWSKKT